MADGRKYNEDEAAEIFSLAVQAGQLSPPSDAGERGMSLADLQSIGEEVGIDPARVASAAESVDARGVSLPRRTSVGAPVGVGRVVRLPRELTDLEWETLVAELRDTFHATGRVGRQGGAREWSNGNLRVLLEPTESGHQLRMSTVHGRLMRLGWYGLVGLVTAAVFLVLLLPDLADAEWTLRTLLTLLPTLILGGASAGMLAYNRLALPKWAEERESQMDAIARRAESLGSRSSDEAEDSDPDGAR